MNNKTTNGSKPKGKKTSEAGIQMSEEESNSAPSTNAPNPEIGPLPTANLKLPTENTMEVHHHPEVEKKGIKEYVLEGLMIFLAVTMGFFAETIREGISDKTKGREYIHSFVEDLRKDTANFSNLMAFDKHKLAGLGDIYACYDSLAKDSKSTGCLVPIIKYSGFNKNENFADGTMQQLKNAGGFRLLNKSDKDSIVSYDHATRAYLNFESTIFQQRQDIIRDVDVKLLNFRADVVLSSGYDSLRNSKEAPVLFLNDRALLNEFFNDLVLYKRVTMNQTKIMGYLKRKQPASSNTLIINTIRAMSEG